MIMLQMTIALAAVLHCPPDTGQIRWDVKHAFTVGKATYTVHGSIWDRDRSAGPSKGDVFLVRSARVGDQPMPFEQTWIALGPKLAEDLAQTFAGLGDDLERSCESVLAINEEPQVIAHASALVRHLEAVAAPQKLVAKYEAQMAADMADWAARICKKGKFTPTGAIEEALVQRAAKPYAELGERSIRAAARAAAADPGLSCTRLSQEKISFD